MNWAHKKIGLGWIGLVENVSRKWVSTPLLVFLSFLRLYLPLSRPSPTFCLLPCCQHCWPRNLDFRVDFCWVFFFLVVVVVVVGSGGDLGWSNFEFFGLVVWAGVGWVKFGDVWLILVVIGGDGLAFFAVVVGCGGGGWLVVNGGGRLWVVARSCILFLTPVSFF